jgi:hypothetical protein
MNRVVASWSLLVAVVVAGCASAAEPPVSFTSDVLPGLKRHCVMCHLPGSEQGGLGLHPDPWSSIVSVPSTQSPLNLVEPGAPEQSYFYIKIIGTHLAAGGAGLPMPWTYSLEPSQIEVIRLWIEQGARPD